MTWVVSPFTMCCAILFCLWQQNQVLKHEALKCHRRCNLAYQSTKSEIWWNLSKVHKVKLCLKHVPKVASWSHSECRFSNRVSYLYIQCIPCVFCDASLASVFRYSVLFYILTNVCVWVCFYWFFYCLQNICVSLLPVFSYDVWPLYYLYTDWIYTLTCCPLMNTSVKYSIT